MILPPRPIGTPSHPQLCHVSAGTLVFEAALKHRPPLQSR